MKKKFEVFGKLRINLLSMKSEKQNKKWKYPGFGCANIVRLIQFDKGQYFDSMIFKNLV